MSAKTYDRAQVLQVAAQLFPYFMGLADEPESECNDPCEAAVGWAMELLDEVERQCPQPGKSEATLQP